MQYRSDKKGNRLSVLGYGCMRFTTHGGKIDIDKACSELKAAIDAGVNYFDTAYVYPGSEVALGEILTRLNCREQIYIATKLPHYLIKSLDSIEKHFNEQLRRLRTDYIDYYLMHMLTDTDTWEKLKCMGIEQWIEDKMASGKIRNIGFSYHGNSDMFCKLIDAYDWDFCQIQYNYIDEHSQAGRKGLNYAASKNIPVIIMEPLRGGRLANMLPKSALEVMNAAKNKHTPAEWAFKWLWNQPEVTVILSGMNSLEMVNENVKTACETLPGSLTPEEEEMYDKIRDAINKSMLVGCTGCGYCMPCPYGVDIPGTFRCYNETSVGDKKKARNEYLQCTAFRKTPSSASLCKKCGKCEKHCPQSINIREELERAAKTLETPIYKIAKTAIRIFKLW